VSWLALRPAWYRLRAALRRDRAGYLAIVLIVGLVGGLAMGSVAAARRTQSAFPRILAASNPSDLDVDPGPYSDRMIDQISHLPRVRSAESRRFGLGIGQSLSINLYSGQQAGDRASIP
jgi:hypothetical protein